MVKVSPLLQTEDPDVILLIDPHMKTSAPSGEMSPAAWPVVVHTCRLEESAAHMGKGYSTAMLYWDITRNFTDDYGMPTWQL